MTLPDRFPDPEPWPVDDEQQARLEELARRQQVREVEAAYYEARDRASDPSLSSLQRVRARREARNYGRRLWRLRKGM